MRSKKAPKKSPRFWIGILLIFGAVGVYVVVQRTPLQRTADEAVEALWRGDTQLLIPYETTQEKAVGIDQGKIAKVFNELVQPGFKWIKSRGSMTVLDDPNPESGSTGQIPINLINDRTFPLKVHTFIESGEPRISVLATVLTYGWEVRYYGTAKRSDPKTDEARAILAGVQADRSKLEAMGIPGMLSATDQKLRNWDEVELALKKRLYKGRQ